MKINQTEKYKSLDTLINIELPDFAILTGVNGAGKTHLLMGISTGEIKVMVSGTVLEPKKDDCKYVSSQTLIPNEGTIATKEQLDKKSKVLWDQYSNYLLNKNKNNNLRIENFIEKKEEREVVLKIAKDANKNIDDLIANDFYLYFPIDEENYQNVFHQNFSYLFKRYQLKFEENKYNQFRNTKGIVALSDNDFYLKFGEEPWNLVNKILREAKLDYQISSPSDLHRDAPFELKLINTTSKAEIKFSELSSGEKVLMSLALALYNSSTNMVFPKLLLMDEPDASLHPSMSKQFLDVIENVFVRDKGISVLITTHSPSTVALCNEDCLFVMNKTGERIGKSTKDSALRVLTAGVPSFSVNYENRRQVFVESKYDVHFYERIYEKLKSKVVSDISLNFIASGVREQGNSVQVQEVVSKISGFGNKFVFGIIDWDKKNTSSGFVKVLGEGKRYSIENYLFDPLLISSFLLRERIFERNELGLTDSESYLDFKNFSSVKLQSISDYFISKVDEKVKSSEINKEKTKYANNVEIDVPIWYLHHQGHDLETILKGLFPKLNKYKNEGDLKSEIVDKVIDDMPELIPYDFIELFYGIQNH